MKKSVTILALCTYTLTAQVHARALTQCQIDKYDAYIDASLQWYKNLTRLTAIHYPHLSNASDGFFSTRQHHFELSRAVAHDYLQHAPTQIATNRTVEAWIQLETNEVEQLANRNDDVGQLAKVSFRDRQTEPHMSNYALRSAFATLLSNEQQVNRALALYNQRMDIIKNQHCE